MRLLLVLMLFPLIFAGSCDPSMRCFDQYDDELGGDMALFEQLRDHDSTQPLDEVMSDRVGVGVGQIQQELNAARDTVWRTNRIQVCWEDSSWREEDQAKRDSVRDVIEKTWEDALYISESQNVRFVGWERCSEGNNDGIRIQVTDSGPKVKELGNGLAGMRNGMHLNFDFNNWSTGCSSSWANDSCIRSIAVHEFGHALGIAHEQNRHDRERGAEDSGVSCEEDQQQGSDGDLLIGPWDPDSVMNYCNPIWNNGGQLSDLDRAGIRALYFPELLEGVYCMPTSEFDAIVYEDEVASNIFRSMDHYAANYDLAFEKYINLTQGLPERESPGTRVDDRERFDQALLELARREQRERQEIRSI